MHAELPARCPTSCSRRRAPRCGSTWVAVDRQRAGADALRDAQRPPDVACPDRPRQAVGRVVGLGDRVRLVVEGDDRDDRPEDLLADDAHVRARVVEDRRRQERALVERGRRSAPRRPGPARRPPRDRPRRSSSTRSRCRWLDQRAHLRLRRRPDRRPPRLRGRLHEQLHHPIVDASARRGCGSARVQSWPALSKTA